MRPRPVFDLRQVRLANTLAQFLANGLHHLLLRHGTIHSAQRAFHLAQVANFLSQFHISHRNIYIAICDTCQELDYTYFEGFRRISWEGGCREPPGVYLSESMDQLLHFSVSGPVRGCFISPPVRFASRCAAFNWKYHFAGRSASSISMRCGLCFRPSACSSMVRRSCSTNLAKTNFSNSAPKGIQRKMFQAATTSMRHCSRVMGVTVVSDENQYFPARMVSVRTFGNTKSMVVVMDSAAA